MAPLGRFELPTHGLGIRCSIHTELQGYLYYEFSLIIRFEKSISLEFFFQSGSVKLLDLAHQLMR